MARHAARAASVVGAAALAAVLCISPLPASAPSPAGGGPVAQPSTDPAAACGQVRGGRPVACPHGNDTPPPGVSLYHRPTPKELQARTTLHSPSPRLRGLAALEQATTAAAAGPGSAAEVPCIGDGTLGNRVQMVYARSPLVADRYASLLPSFRQGTAELDQPPGSAPPRPAAAATCGSSPTRTASSTSPRRC
jgi:hypothetical protein